MVETTEVTDEERMREEVRVRQDQWRSVTGTPRPGRWKRWDCSAECGGNARPVCGFFCLQNRDEILPHDRRMLPAPTSL